MRDCTPHQTPTRQLSALTLSVLLMLSAPLASIASPKPKAKPGPIDQVRALGNAALLVEDGGQARIAYHPDRALIPASTMKLLTALHALDRWGQQYRFATELYIDANKVLWIKGLGDPYLVSEEIDHIIAALKAKGLQRVAGIGIDASLFAPTLRIPGRSSSNNPYDAPITALAVNFNTINVRIAGGTVYSAETQTPLTPLARQLARGLAAGRHRINLKDRSNALRYAGELFAAKLRAAGIRVADNGPADNPITGPITGPLTGRVPADARLLLRHRNTHRLEQVITNMLKYSTNFVANDLFLLLGGHDRQQRSLASAQRAASDWASRRFGWDSFRIEDGAGLSHQNRLSARQLLQTLDAFAPHRELMPSQRGNSAIRAKTGTLRGISTYAGYVRRNGHWSRFALLINQPVNYSLRLRVASELAGK